MSYFLPRPYKQEKSNSGHQMKQISSRLLKNSGIFCSKLFFFFNLVAYCVLMVIFLISPFLLLCFLFFSFIYNAYPGVPYNYHIDLQKFEFRHLFLFSSSFLILLFFLFFLKIFFS